MPLLLKRVQVFNSLNFIFFPFEGLQVLEAGELPEEQQIPGPADEQEVGQLLHAPPEDKVLQRIKREPQKVVQNQAPLHALVSGGSPVPQQV